MLLAQTAITAQLVLKFLHILPAVIAGGALLAALVQNGTRGRGAASALAKTLSVAEYSLYALFVVGAILGFMLRGANGRMLIAAPWLSISMLLWIIIIAVLHAMVRKPVRVAAVNDDTSVLPSKVGTGLIIMNILWVVTLLLMVIRIPA